jgi:putative transposase
MEGKNNYYGRKSIRLKGYDYSTPGYYFVTICTHKRENILGEINNGILSLTALGKLAEYTWYDLPNHNSHIGLDEFVVMPNHIHGIIIINDNMVNSAGAGSEPAPTDITIKNKYHSLPEIIRQFKTFSARRINEKRKVKSRPVWQRNYFEHVIRNNNSLNQIRQYIKNNPLKWEIDINNYTNK